MPLIEKCRRLWGQQIHCNEGATSESDSFDLSMVSFSNKLTSNRGYLVWLGAICAGIINWPNSGIYGKTCALSLLKLFVEAKCAVQGSCLKLLWLSTRMMNFQDKSIITFFNEHIAEVVFFPLQKPLISHINERDLLQTEASVLRLSQYISHFAVNKGLELCYVIIQSRCLQWSLCLFFS